MSLAVWQSKKEELTQSELHLSEVFDAAKPDVFDLQSRLF